MASDEPRQFCYSATKYMGQNEPMLWLSFIFVHDDPLFSGHYCAFIVLSDPRSNMDRSIKILGFHTAMSCQDVKLHSVPLQTNVI